MKPGMTASVTITVDRREGVLNLPSAAVRGTGTTGTVTLVTGKTQSTKSVGVGSARRHHDGDHERARGR